MKINNENENIYYISYFIQIFYISNFHGYMQSKISKNILTCEETRNMIHDYLSKKNIFKYIFDYLIEEM